MDPIKSEPTLKRKTRGRPKKEEASEPVSIRLYPSEYDRLIRMARRRDQTISSLVRSLLMFRPR
jgi:hypothetical protein